MAVQRNWRHHSLKPHLIKTFKLSRDKHFVEKLTDVVGLYLNPPDKSLVLCLDEKSQIQALDRTQPGLPIKKGRCGTMTHDYKRPGTATLFAALSMLDGRVIGDCMPHTGTRSLFGFSILSMSALLSALISISLLTIKRIHRGVFTSVPDLMQAIHAYLNNHSQNPKAFVWSAPVERILEKIAKCKEALGTLH